jgi:hypothetical protein
MSIRLRMGICGFEAPQKGEQNRQPADIWMLKRLTHNAILDDGKSPHRNIENL